MANCIRNDEQVNAIFRAEFQFVGIVLPPQFKGLHRAVEMTHFAVVLLSVPLKSQAKLGTEAIEFCLVSLESCQPTGICLGKSTLEESLKHGSTDALAHVSRTSRTPLVPVDDMARSHGELVAILTAPL